MDGDQDLSIDAYHAWLGTPACGAGDVNGDGYEDIIAGHLFIRPTGDWTGRAYILYGGQAFDNDPDVKFYSPIFDYDYPTSVSSAGDVNGDGYDDVLWGTSEEYMASPGSGHAYLHFGGPAMSSTPNLAFTEGGTLDWFGDFVSTAGDVNKDGYDDIIVGADANDSGGPDSGRAYLYFGGPGMDNKTDVVFTGGAPGDFFGVVSDAGDVNGDGYGDVIVGAPLNDQVGDRAGAAYIYYGGENMDSVADVTLFGWIPGDRFGYSVSGAGDLDKDGHDDVIVGTFGGLGHAYIFFGGKAMDNIPDVSLAGAYDGAAFGYSVSEAGDVNSDGYQDVVIGAWGSTVGPNTGRVYLYTMIKPVSGVDIALGPNDLLKGAELFPSTTTEVSFSQELDGYLRTAPVSGTDAFGNSYVDVPLNLTAQSGGNITLSDLSIVYDYNATTRDFAGSLNKYLADHKKEKDNNGDIKVPIEIEAKSAGRIRLSGLKLERDLPPVLAAPIPAAEMDEDMANSDLVDLYPWFEDDIAPDEALEFLVVSTTNSSLVRLWISGGRYLAADAETGSANDNWTGTVEVAVGCADGRGQKTVSNLFTIAIKNVNDPPVVTSEPALEAEPGVPYSYQVVAVDGDRDTLHYRLARSPAGMTIDPAGGKVDWLPGPEGAYEVGVVVQDGQASAEQRFSISVPERPPVITAEPSFNASVGGGKIQIAVVATDPNGDDLTYEWQEKGVTLSNDRTFIKRFSPGKHTLVLLIGDGHQQLVRIFNFTVEPDPASPDAGLSITGGAGPVAAVVIMSTVLFGLALAAGTETGKYKMMLLFVPLYTRLKKDKILDHETRGMIKGFVYADPGIHYNEIIRRLKLGNGTAAYHLKTLEREGFIVSRSDGFLRRFYPAGRALLEIPPKLDKVQRIILETVQENEGLGQRKIARLLKLPPSTVNRQINTLVKMGLLRLEMHGVTTRCYLVNEKGDKGLV
jgi:DNA-binding MarR family transcriptional regulator